MLNFLEKKNKKNYISNHNKENQFYKYNYRKNDEIFSILFFVLISVD